MTERGLCKSRSRAKMLIAEGKVTLNGNPLQKASVIVKETDVLSLSDDLQYVGRGGLKMEGALQNFPISVKNRICMDVGASTGGFTDCMLQNGAELVYAIDVGKGQLDESLCQNPKVVNLENTDIRFVESLPEMPDFCGIDVSFISLKLVLPSVYRLLAEKAECVALIKPQFEAGRQNIGKHGIVKSAKAHKQVLQEVTAFAQEIGFQVQGVCISPVQGGSGNIEYLAYLTKNHSAENGFPDFDSLVKLTGLRG